MRDPYWLSAGWEVAGGGGAPPTVLWSQPEVALYDADDHTNRPGYPDFITHRAPDGVWDVAITETQKTAARLHRVDRRLLSGLFAQHNASTAATGAALRLDATSRAVPTPALPAFDGSAAGAVGVGGLGFAIALALDGHDAALEGQTVLSSEVGGGGGVALLAGTGGQLTLRFSDGHATFSLSTDAACSAALGAPGRHVFGAVADGGPRIATLMVDGVLCDGAGVVDFGWAWFPPLGSVRGGATMRVAPDYTGRVAEGLVWTRMLTTSEMVGT